MDKLCPTCKTVKDTDLYFGKDCTRKDGIRAVCNECLRKKRIQNKGIEKQKRRKRRESVERYIETNIHNLFSYNEDTGLLYNKSTGIPVEIKVHPKGYYTTYVKGFQFRVHRLIWFFVHNEWPEYVDHIDGDVQNNRLSNLRNCNNAENQCNQHAHRDGKLPGCNLNCKSGKWNVQFHENKQNKCLGSYTTEREASLVYCRYVLKHGLVRREFLPSIFTDEELYGEDPR